MKNDLRGPLVGLMLEANAHPAASVPGTLIAACGNGVGEGEESLAVAAIAFELVQQRLEFLLEHRLQALAADISLGGAVDRVTDRHVVGGDGFGDGSGSAADCKKPASHFLPAANFGEGAVGGGVEVDGQCFVACADGRVGHDSCSSFIEAPNRPREL